MSQASPPRQTIPFQPGATYSSPTSVAWDGASSEKSFEEPQQQPPYELPSLDDVDAELQRLVKQSACSKASYRARLVKMNNELNEANKVVQTVEEKLSAARRKEAIAQKTVEDARQRREVETETLIVRRLHLQILRRCMDEPDLLPELRQLQEAEDSAGDKYKHHSSLELKVIRRRLEDIRTLFDKAERAKATKVFETQSQAHDMKREAISTYILFHKFSQI